MPQGHARPARLGAGTAGGSAALSSRRGVPPAPCGCIREGWDPRRDSPWLGGWQQPCSFPPPPPPWDAFGIILPCEKHRLLLRALQLMGFSLRQQPLSGSLGGALGQSPPLPLELPNPVSRRGTAGHRSPQAAGGELRLCKAA